MKRKEQLKVFFYYTVCDHSSSRPTLSTTSSTECTLHTPETSRTSGNTATEASWRTLTIWRSTTGPSAVRTSSLTEATTTEDSLTDDTQVVTTEVLLHTPISEDTTEDSTTNYETFMQKMLWNVPLLIYNNIWLRNKLHFVSQPMYLLIPHSSYSSIKFDRKVENKLILDVFPINV